MAYRTTKADIDRAFTILLRAIDGEPGRWTRDEDGRSVCNVGGYVLDNASQYGGVRVERFANERGGIETPWGNNRMKPADFVDAVDFSVSTIAERDRNQS